MKLKDKVNKLLDCLLGNHEYYDKSYTNKYNITFTTYHCKHCLKEKEGIFVSNNFKGEK